MAPYVSYKLDEDAFARYDALLAAQGVTVFPKSRDTFEILDDPERSIITTHGVVQHEGSECRFDLRRGWDGASFALYVVDERDTEARLAIMDAVERAFPQPERPIETSPFFANYGCLLCLAFIVLACVFAVIEVYNLFR
jgi:hypothetical protein